MELDSVPFDFWSALLASAFGLVSGAIGSLVAPWVHYFIERRRKSIEYKIDCIAKVRELLNGESSMADIKRSSFWGFIDDHLNDKERREALSDRSISIQSDSSPISQDSVRKQAISKMLSRLEKEWGLTK